MALTLPLLVLVLAAWPGDPAAGQRGTDPPQQPAPAAPGPLASVQAWANRLVWELERLQEDITAELSGRKERDLYRRADAVLHEVLQFQDSVKTGASREQLRRSYQMLNSQLHQLIEAIRALGSGEQALQRAARRLRAADQQLHYALARGPADKPEPEDREVLERQALLLAIEANLLHQTAAYGLPPTLAGRKLLEASLKKFAEQAGRFQERVGAGDSLPQLRQEFAKLDGQWRQMRGTLRSLTRLENAFLLRTAERVDLQLARLHQELGMKGTRPVWRQG